MVNVEVVFIPSPGKGHISAALQMAKLLTSQDERLVITFLIFTLPFDDNSLEIQPLLDTSTPRIRFKDLPKLSNPGFSDPGDGAKIRSVVEFELITKQKPHVRDAILELMNNNSLLACVVVDMFCAYMIDVANDLGLPSYVFYTSGAGFLGLMFHVQALYDVHNQDVTNLKNSPDVELSVPSFSRALTSKVMPTAMLDKNGGFRSVCSSAQRFRMAKGIIINTFEELESYAIKSLEESNGENPPRIYPVGPVIDLIRRDDDSNNKNMIISWLDSQPSSSVVFLCFGSLGCFSEDQAREIALALERSGCRFLWSLRRPPPEGRIDVDPSDYATPEEVLPEGFLERTSGVGRVIGRAPQVAVLSHPATGGFISHCGWNSILESLWFGVPLATWPMYAEQQLNAFEMTEELGIAVEIRNDYRKEMNADAEVIVSADEIERGIRELMMEGNGNYKRKQLVEDMKAKSRRALSIGGSSYSYLRSLINEIVQSVS